jgi:monovalent cation:H+ antiporter-2, CPA2 family
MAAPINIDAYSDALVLLGTAGIVVPLARRWGLSPVLGFLGAGAALGPLGLGSFIDRLPFLYWITVVDAKNVAGIADLGVVFLLFLIGMGLSYERLKTMRCSVILCAACFQSLSRCCPSSAVIFICCDTHLA